jgi:hypothetical protein
MVLERQLLPFSEWLWGSDQYRFGAVAIFLFIAAALCVLALVGGFLVALVRHGPLKAGDLTYRTVRNGAKELFFISPRRVWALARLAIQESIRRRVIVVFVVYLLILLFAGWFLQTNYPEPAKLYFSFVLTATSYLVLVLALLLSAFSLPADIKSKTIYTVVTKPVRAGEIVLGRMLGFTLIGTVLLVVMGICSYVFVVRSMEHTHTIEAASLTDVADSTTIKSSGRTSQDAHHRHIVEQDVEGNWRLSEDFGHTHWVDPPRGSVSEVRLTGPRGHLTARVPMYGAIRFIDRNGNATGRGISVGDEWTYRSFIDGNTPARAIWTFSGVDESIDPEGLPLWLIVRVFRTHKGVITQGIAGQIYLKNPETGMQSESQTFTAKDDQLNNLSFLRKLKNTNGEEIDLYDDLVSEDGKIEVWVRCVEAGQYFGFAQPDAYLLLADASHLVNFIKANVGIWIQMVLVIAIGVACSTFVSGPVAMLFTVSFILLGLYRDYFLDIAVGDNYGGGPIESLVRLVTQMNVTSPLEGTIGDVSTAIIQGVDGAIRGAMFALAQVLPDFPRFNTSAYVAEGYNIPANQVGQDLLICLAYVFGLFVVGYFFLRTREIAK